MNVSDDREFVDAIHGRRPVDAWWGCEQPERPFEYGKTGYNPMCRGCLIAAQAAEAHGHGNLVEHPDWPLQRPLTEFIIQAKAMQGIDE